MEPSDAIFRASTDAMALEHGDATLDDPGVAGPGGGPPDEPRRWHVEVVARTGSTNADLVAAALGGAPDRSVLVARHQTAGRGRLDRRWDAPAGANLLVSILFRDVPERPHELTWRVGLAACAAAFEVAGVDAVLKWPNDVLVDDAKLAGVLAQAGSGFVVVGMGLNVRWAPPGAARLGDAFEPLDVLDAMLRALDGPPPEHGVFEAYRTKLATLGTRVRVQLSGREDVHGRAIGLERDGRLVVIDECGMTHRFDSGDVVHLR